MPRSISTLALIGSLAAATLYLSCGQMDRHKMPPAEWSQWRGPNRDGISLETGLLKSWPKEGPEVLWRIPFGSGFSGVSISGGHAYTMLADSTDEYVVCLDASSGEEKWRVRADSTFVEEYGHDRRRR